MRPKLPWWTWIAPYFASAAGTLLSLHTQLAPGISFWYLPTALGLAMAQWWGLRVLLGIYVNAVVFASSWGLPNSAMWPLNALPETVAVGLSLLLTRRLQPSAPSLGDLRALISYLIVGLALPLLLGALMAQAVFVMSGDVTEPPRIWNELRAYFLCDVMTGVMITIPLLGLVTPLLDVRGLSRISRRKTASGATKSRSLSVDFAAVTIILVIGTLSGRLETLPIAQGVAVLWVGVRHGISGAMLVNLAVGILALTLAKRGDAAEAVIGMQAGFIIVGVAGLLNGQAITDMRTEMLRRDESENQRRESERRLHQSQKLEVVGQLASGIAHDFNNILTVIAGQATMIQRRASDAAGETAQAARTIKDAAMRAASLTKKLLTFARQTARENSIVDLNAVVLEVWEVIDRTFDKSITIKKELSDELLQVRGDPAVLQSVLLNLAVNARDAMAEGGQLTITTRADEDGVTIQFADTGIGMDPATLQRAFEPFFTTKPVGKGTGLGLAMVYGAVTDHGGTIEANSKPGEGSTFTIDLPRVAFSAQSAAKVLPSPALGSLRVMIIDDQEQVLSAASGMLRNLGCAASTFSDGDEAIAQFDIGRYDVVLIDLLMPGLNAMVTLERLRAIDPDILAIMMSGLESAGISTLRDEIQTAGFQGILHKPFGIGDLERQLVQVIRTIKT